MPLTDNLVGYWALEEASGNRSDAAGTNTLTDNNTVTQAVGKVANAAQFVAANSEYLSRADNAGLSLGASSCTITVWAYLASKGSHRFIVAKNDDGAVPDGSEYLLYFDAAADRFRFSVYTPLGGATTVSDTHLGSPALNTWYFLVAWHDDAGNTINLQINNGTADSVAFTGAPNDTATAFTIGGSALPSNFWDGRLDEIGFWKRALTAGERTTLYNSGVGLTYPFIADPVGATVRYSAMNIASPWRGLHTLPVGSITQAERQAVMFMYSGVLATPSIIPVLSFTRTFLTPARSPNVVVLRRAATFRVKSRPATIVFDPAAVRQ